MYVFDCESVPPHIQSLISKASNFPFHQYCLYCFWQNIWPTFKVTVWWIRPIIFNMIQITMFPLSIWFYCIRSNKSSSQKAQNIKPVKKAFKWWIDRRHLNVLIPRKADLVSFKMFEQIFKQNTVKIDKTELKDKWVMKSDHRVVVEELIRYENIHKTFQWWKYINYCDGHPKFFEQKQNKNKHKMKEWDTLWSQCRKVNVKGFRHFREYRGLPRMPDINKNKMG